MCDVSIQHRYNHVARVTLSPAGVRQLGEIDVHDPSGRVAVETRSRSFSVSVFPAVPEACGLCTVDPPVLMTSSFYGAETGLRALS
jgi:hypothetical protein